MSRGGMQRALVFASVLAGVCDGSQQSITAAEPFPLLLRGEWFSWEEGREVDTSINEGWFKSLGQPVDAAQLRRDSFQYVFSHHQCFVCVRLLVRSWNVLEKLEGPCVSDGSDVAAACRWLEGRQQSGVMLFRSDPTPINCRPALHGLFHFAWQNKFSFTGECDHPEAMVRSCQEPGSQFLIDSQKFTINFKKCEGVGHSFDATREYTCLGDWYVGRNHYFAVANTKESRREERYRCFVRDREEDLYMGLSITPECLVLKTPQNSPVRFRLSYAKHEIIPPGCYLPRNLTGKWESSGIGEAQMVINSTHITETMWRGYAAKTTTYTCLEQRGNRYLMAKQSVEGCQTEYVCWELVPRHHNIVRYRVSWALIYQDFQVCDYANFRSGREWKYDTLIADSPAPVSCPFGGRFMFQQEGGSPLQPRIVGGITTSPLDSYHCPTRRTVMSVCDRERRLIEIDLDLCVSLNKDGHPVDFNSVIDYRLQCVGFWQENLLSYLVTHDPSDSVSRFRCWVYQRVSDTQIRLSQSVGAACGLRQTFMSSNFTESASVALTLTLNERLYDYCPMFYDNGKNPWQEQDRALTIFTFTDCACPSSFASKVILLVPVLVLFGR
ncbi:uncharacterized protein LOC123508688 isoform X1 [Portunus trituberculatus]|uniref:uncharacterized protein LOC123508688 isoform X1 n=1 Tax=Portunus trituberculatus TaxID=210409 RepID=UPI001E1CC414|nr:uncharacterized protein LOC123508688 isoform X1 [Portunus trituberculatus]